MSESTNLRIEGPLRRWGREVALVSTSDPSGRLAMVFGPPVMDPAAVADAVARARSLVGVEVPGLLTLRRVDQVKGRLGYGYDVIEATSLAVLTRQRRAMPPAAAAGILASIAQTACDLGQSALHHPGPTKHDVLVEASGRVWLAGLAGPRRVDEGHADESALVRSLGGLLAAMLSGTTWPAPRTAAGHEENVRGLIEPIAGRLEPAYRRLIRGVLAWNPERRPSLVEVVETARAVAVAPDGEPLNRWVRRVWQLTRDAPVPAPAEPSGFDAFVPDPDAIDRPTQPSDDSEPLPLFDENDDDTVMSEHPAPPTPQLEQGTIPVAVGPPPEAMRRRLATLELFGRGITQELHRRPEETGPTPWWLVVTGSALGVIAFVLAVALVYGPF